ncbi:unnamed protein product [Haemonchus placei]|uniref:V-type proton ATPase subunit C n=1 Tax=Haemonchus placei TaxID=6290 RepID=A0A0N4WHT5_HAEPC|nr:unnamed protein product [Haemonchus placei]
MPAQLLFFMERINTQISQGFEILVLAQAYLGKTNAEVISSMERQYAEQKAKFEKWKIDNSRQIGTESYNKYVQQFLQWEKEVFEKKAKVAALVQSEAAIAAGPANVDSILGQLLDDVLPMEFLMALVTVHMKDNTFLPCVIENFRKAQTGELDQSKLLVSAAQYHPAVAPTPQYYHPVGTASHTGLTLHTVPNTAVTWATTAAPAGPKYRLLTAGKPSDHGKKAVPELENDKEALSSDTDGSVEKSVVGRKKAMGKRCRGSELIGAGMARVQLIRISQYDPFSIIHAIDDSGSKSLQCLKDISEKAVRRVKMFVSQPIKEHTLQCFISKVQAKKEAKESGRIAQNCEVKRGDDVFPQPLQRQKSREVRFLFTIGWKPSLAKRLAFQIVKNQKETFSLLRDDSTEDDLELNAEVALDVSKGKVKLVNMPETPEIMSSALRNCRSSHIRRPHLRVVGEESQTLRKVVEDGDQTPPGVVGTSA